MQDLQIVLDQLLSKSKGQSAFNEGIRFNIRGLWNGSLSRFEFTDGMVSVTTLGFSSAWTEGAKSCGILPSERTSEENEVLQNRINQNISFVPGLADFITENSKLNSGFLRDAFERGDLWQRRYNEVVNQAKIMACGNQKFQWRIGVAEHCKTCLKLNFRVMRASQWAKLDIWPQDTRPGKLACRGFRCKCSLHKTDKRATPGPLPRLG